MEKKFIPVTYDGICLGYIEIEHDSNGNEISVKLLPMEDLVIDKN